MWGCRAGFDLLCRHGLGGVSRSTHWIFTDVSLMERTLLSSKMMGC